MQLANNHTDDQNAEEILTSLTCSEPIVVIVRGKKIKLCILVLVRVSTGTVAMGH